jgi:tRNA A-37 threonylcarbamoyl transferase component Bud32
VLDHSTTSHDLGDLANEYILLGVLGRGGSAIVYRARDRALHREVAIKVVRPRYTASADEAIARLEREARTVARLQHPNIVTVHAVKRLADGGVALVMQLVPGRTLKETIQREGPFAPERAERVMRDIAQALAFAHANGVVHRDVKPENVFLDAASGRALLSDFGIAHNSEFDARLTLPGASIGTPAYMAPEQIDHATANARSDLYSLGVVTWEMLTGLRPWGGDALYTVIYKQKHEELPAIDSVRPGAVPARLQYIVERMLQKKPGARWAGADGLLAALDAWVTPADWKQWEASHRQRRLREASAPQAAIPAAPSVQDATVRFMRPAGDAAPVGGATPGPSVATTAQPALPAATQGGTAPPADDEDSAPTWAALPEEEEPAPPPARRRGRWAVLSLLGLASAAAAVWASGVPLPGLPTALFVPDAPAAVELPLMEIPVPALAAADSVAANGPSPEELEAERAALDAVRLDSLLRLARQADSVRSDSLERALERARARIARLVAGPAEGEGIRATDDPPLVAAGVRHSCLLMDGRVACWGSNDRGQLGETTGAARQEPVFVRASVAFRAVTAGGQHSCAIDVDGRAFCWGAADRGQLGDGTSTSRAYAAQVAGGQRFRRLQAGAVHNCGLTTAGAIACWGANEWGQLGDGSAATRTVPTVVRGGLRFISVSVGRDHSCGVASDGSAYCWGRNERGALGDGSTRDSRKPVPVSSALRFTSIAAGDGFTCAVSDATDVWCWGQNDAGQLGMGTPGEAQLTPVRTAVLARFTSVSAGTAHACARTTDGQAWCWGRSSVTGDDGLAARGQPTRVGEVESLAALSAGGTHACGYMAGAAGVWCWGSGDAIGAGTRGPAPWRAVRLPRPSNAPAISP